jgi:Zn-dependent protease/CBS domain-containing protein
MLLNRMPSPVFAGRLWGIPIRLDWSWMPMIPLYSWAIAGVFLPTAAPGHSPVEYWLLGALTTLLLVVSVVAHELAHALVARAEGLEVYDITVHLFGGMARLSGDPPTPAAELKIAVVGPGASFALGMLFLLLDTLLLNGTTYVAEAQVLRHLGILNLVLATFNLLPGFPLDGGRVLKAVLWKRRGDPVSALRTARSAGRSIAIGMVAVGIYVFLYTDRLTGLWSLLMGAVLLLVLGPTDSYAAALMSTVVDRMRRPPVAVAPGTTVHELVNDVLPVHKQTAFLVTVDGRLHGVLSLESIRDLPREAWRSTTVGSRMYPVDEAFFVTSNTPISVAARQLTSNGVGCAAVLDGDGTVIGSLNTRDVAAGKRA